ncbi:DUF2399 domain-containing protein [Deinococcus radiomollis]|uniref:DUF2399 domain-containing protein n=1 Tax=Deinococcus radiomollis TaxID=468916 RepID=UPI00389294DC
MKPAAALADLNRLGLRPVLEAALLRYRRSGELGRSQPKLPAEAWLALSRLTGQPEDRRSLDLALLDTALRASRYALSLPELLEELNGSPIRVRRQAREEFGAQWAALLAAVADPDWQAALKTGGAGAATLRGELRTGEEAERVTQIVSAALAITRSETLSFPVLAARLTGDAHALDTDTPAGKVFRAALDTLQLPPPERDGVSSTVLFANLRGPEWLNAAAGHCLALPWREVQRLGSVHAAGNRLWVVENPSVFEALHADCPAAPLLYTGGQPGAATMSLLARLPADTTAHLSCDLDLGGLRIASYLRRSVPLHWRPWRMDAAAHALATGRGAAPLKGDPARFAAEFPGLVLALEQSGQGAHQENLLAELLADLKAAQD